ncbi:hypothetical protein [Legionella israelensis]|uniref:Uncharacterized protein n=1 Tax=Legionella israelensis TaxID=454 RepID=A0A0W0V4W4_9GAMM|nr:hypothetical protein [Legionella israelensis]KTD14941.1 hypothetical protein Lisr_2286 [Legionella israelensis]QBS09594.1 hypothetical protein E4T55_06810 [Legionella israelensis]QDP71573.1 hypothetical protein FOG18_02770 [Legionella israelensis]SCY23883.1 hypothetical protein SAMN02746069_01749 [Legionella israelensis DSM 19235]STX60518.1 Uncharacterised protein [Legionella israelensis]
MNKIFLNMFLLLLFLPAQAADIPEAEIEDQKHDQEMCVQQRVNQCIDVMCQTSEDINCTQICEQNAKNECLQAGE